MIWLTWRQHRTQAAYLLLGLAVIAAALIPLGRSMHHAYDLGVGACLKAKGNPEFFPTNSGPDQGCHDVADAFSSQYGYLLPIAVLLVILPLLVGLFFGAPLIAREVEHGTHRLVWTQGVGRLRWATTKLGLVGLTGLVLAAGYAALLTWWVQPINVVAGSRLAWLVFDLQGVVPLAYTVFAFALGVAAGAASRKLLPAMGITLAAFVVTRVLVTWLGRPHFIAPVDRKTSVVSDVRPNELHGDWIISSGIYDASGRQLVANGNRYCPLSAQLPPGLQDQCDPSIYNLERIQPAGRFWTFQWIETGLYAALAAALLALALYRVRRKIA